MQENAAVVTRLTPHLEHTIHTVKCAGEDPGVPHNVIHRYYSQEIPTDLELCSEQGAFRPFSGVSDHSVTS